MATWQPNYTKSTDVLIKGYAYGVNFRTTVDAILKESGALSEIERLTKALEELEMELQDANEHIEMLENS